MSLHEWEVGERPRRVRRRLERGDQPLTVLLAEGAHRANIKRHVRDQALRLLACERVPRGLLPRLHAARELWLQREAVRHARRDPLAEPAATRLPRLLLALLTDEVERRGGETSIEEERRTVHLSIVGSPQLTPTGRVYLLRCEGWRHYSGRFGARRATLAYLAGRDDGGRWAARVPGTMGSAAEALAWLEPAAVRKARDAGRSVVRQGDVYAVEATSAHDGKGELPEDHEWDAERRTLTHHTHHHLRIEHPVRFFSQSVLAMGRTGGRQRGD
jgi:hypothetical protein